MMLHHSKWDKFLLISVEVASGWQDSQSLLLSPSPCLFENPSDSKFNFLYLVLWKQMTRSPKKHQS